MTRPSESSGATGQKNSKRWIIPTLSWAGTIVTALVTSWFVTDVRLAKERPDVKMVGALPFHIISKLDGPYSTQSQNHKLGFIAKLENTSPTPADVHLAMLSGCVPLDPLTAAALSGFDADGVQLSVVAEEFEDTVQKIVCTGIVNESSRVIPGFSIAYVAVLFPIKKQGGYVGPASTTISKLGDCQSITVASSDPNVFQLFDINRLHYEYPKDVAQGIRSGALEFSLFISNSQIEVIPEQIGKLRTINLKNWENLRLPQAYENPDTQYLLTEREE